MMIPKTKLKTPPQNLAVSLEKVKTFLRVDGQSENQLIRNQVQAATKRLESLVDKKFVNQTWLIYFDHFPYKTKNAWWDGTREMAISELYSTSDRIDLPFAPLKQLVEFNTYDMNDTKIVYDLSNLSVDTIGPDATIALKDSQVWPATVLRPLNGIEIEAEFGMGEGHIDGIGENPDTESEIPQDIQEAIIQMTAIIYEHRGDELPQIPSSVAMLLDPYRRLKV